MRKVDITGNEEKSKKLGVVFTNMIMNDSSVHVAQRTYICPFLLFLFGCLCAPTMCSFRDPFCECGMDG